VVFNLESKAAAQIPGCVRRESHQRQQSDWCIGSLRPAWSTGRKIGIFL